MDGEKPQPVSQNQEDEKAKLQEEYKRTIKMLIQRDIELRSSNDRLENMARERSEFISLAAHQLRTPLTPIRWIVNELLKQGKTGKLIPEQNELVEKLDFIVKKMVVLVGDILNVVKIEEGKFGFEFAKIDLAETLEEIVKLNEVNAQARKIKFFYNIERNLPLVRADKDKLKLAINNLLDNAIKYTPPGREVRLEVRKTDDSVSVVVADTGIGIPQGIRDKIFDKFYRADNAVKKETEGSGLGLFITRNIILSHGGTINFVSEESKGTTFTVVLPAAKES